MFIFVCKLHPQKSKTERMCNVRISLEVQGSRGCAVVRALASHQCRPGSISAPYHMWVEFVVGSRPLLRMNS